MARIVTILLLTAYLSASGLFTKVNLKQESGQYYGIKKEKIKRTPTYFIATR